MINEKNRNGEFDSLEYAKTALDLIRRGGADEGTARGLLKVANTSALVSIAGSLREFVTVQRKNHKRADEIKGELKPCPFCGGEVHIAVSSDGYGVECSNDKCVDLLCLDAIPTEAEAIKAWNTRAERACHLEHVNGIDTCSECGADIDTFRNYCQSCGAKVVSDD